MSNKIYEEALSIMPDADKTLLRELSEECTTTAILISVYKDEIERRQSAQAKKSDYHRKQNQRERPPREERQPREDRPRKNREAKEDKPKEPVVEKKKKVVQYAQASGALWGNVSFDDVKPAEKPAPQPKQKPVEEKKPEPAPQKQERQPKQKVEEKKPEPVEEKKPEPVAQPEKRENTVLYLPSRLVSARNHNIKRFGRFAPARPAQQQPPQSAPVEEKKPAPVEEKKPEPVVEEPKPTPAPVKPKEEKKPAPVYEEPKPAPVVEKQAPVVEQPKVIPQQVQQPPQQFYPFGEQQGMPVGMDQQKLYQEFLEFKQFCMWKQQMSQSQPQQQFTYNPPFQYGYPGQGYNNQ